MTREQYAEHVSELHVNYNAQLRAALTTPLGDAKNPDVWWPLVRPIYEAFIKEMDELNRIFLVENSNVPKV